MDLQAVVSEAREDLERDPFDAAATRRLIGAYQELCDVESVCAARQHLCTFALLSREEWLAWVLEEEKRQHQQGEAQGAPGKKEVLLVAHRAIQDLLHVELWLLYLRLVKKYCGTDIAQIRETYAEAVTACRFHLAEGHLVFLDWLAFERTLPLSDTQKIDSIYREALSTPYAHSDIILQSYSQYCKATEREEDCEILRVVREGEARAQFWIGWERQVSPLNLQHNSIQVSSHRSPESSYREAIKMATGGRKDEFLLACALFERLLLVDPADSRVWLEYLGFLAMSLEGKNALVSVSSRALRADRSDVGVRIKRLWIVEESFNDVSLLHGEFLSILKVFEPSSIEDMVDLYFAYFVSVRRLLWSVDKPQARHLYQSAIDRFSSPGLVDPKHSLEKFWMRLEFSSGNLARGREIYEALLEKHPKDTRLWREAIWLECSRQDFGVARDLYRRAIGTTNPEDFDRLAAEYRNFELENGDIGSFQDFEVWLSGCRATSGSAVEIDAKGPSRVGKRNMRNAAKPRTETQNKSVAGTKVSPDESAAKIPKTSVPSGEARLGAVEWDPERTVFISNLAFKTSEQEVFNFFTQKLGNCELVLMSRDRQGQSKGHGYASFSEPNFTTKAMGLDRTMLVGRPLFITKYQPVPRSERTSVSFTRSRDPKVLFVSNLDKGVVQQDLQDFFGACKGLTSIRLVVSKEGKFKGAAYVEFSTEDDAAFGLSLQGRKLRGGSVPKIQISDPEGARNKAQMLQMTPRNVKASQSARKKIHAVGNALQDQNKETAGLCGNEDFKRAFLV